VDAFERNLTPWIVADAYASHTGAEFHQAGLLILRKFIGPRQIQIITTGDLTKHAPAR